jgi:hypothetical protein
MIANKCPAGTFCSKTIVATNYGLDVYPNLVQHACSKGYYCTKGTTTETPCPAGTINPLIGRRSLDECKPTDAG